MRTALRWRHGIYLDVLRKALGQALRTMAEERAHSQPRPISIRTLPNTDRVATRGRG
jgi:hypothetical protein